LIQCSMISTQKDNRERGISSRMKKHSSDERGYFAGEAFSCAGCPTYLGTDKRPLPKSTIADERGKLPSFQLIRKRSGRGERLARPRNDQKKGWTEKKGKSPTCGIGRARVGREFART